MKQTQDLLTQQIDTLQKYKGNIEDELCGYTNEDRRYHHDLIKDAYDSDEQLKEANDDNDRLFINVSLTCTHNHTCTSHHK